MNSEDVEKVLPFAPKQWIDTLFIVMPLYDINTKLRQCAFIAQSAHESTQYTRLRENLNYSAQALVAVFPSHFPSLEFANPYNRNPEMIANFLYANRNGNGDVASGDGWRYRAGGVLGLTFRDNYKACQLSTGLSLLEHPELLEQPTEGIQSGCWFWKEHSLNNFADAGDMETVTKRINGGLTGFPERMNYYNQLMQIQD